MNIKKTKIVGTIGPASESVETITHMIRNGMDIARFSFSHGTYQEKALGIQNIRQAEKNIGKQIPILQDLSGPKVRIGDFSDGMVYLEKGQAFTLTTDPVIGNQHQVHFNTPEIAHAINSGETIFLADGEIQLQAESATDIAIFCQVTAGGELRSRKGITVPGLRLDVDIPTEKDMIDLEFGMKWKVDWIAQSFVRDVSDIQNLRYCLKKLGHEKPIIAKLEKREALLDLEGIIQSVDGLMIARGDLGLEVPLQDIPGIQKKIMRLANYYGKPVITATQMLESMVHNPTPTRAEVTDIANAIYDGTSSVMLSAETAIGQYPVEAVNMMAKVAQSTEEQLDYVANFRSHPLVLTGNLPDAVGNAACQIALEIDASLIICCTDSGNTVWNVSKRRPRSPIAVVSSNPETLRKCLLYWGTVDIATRDCQTLEELISVAKSAVLQSELAKKGDHVVIIAGDRICSAQTNTQNVLQAMVL